MTDITPNATGTVTESPAVPSLDSIAQKMTAMREQTERNQLRATEQTATGQDDEEASSSPEATNNGAEVAELDTEIDSGVEEVSEEAQPEQDVSNTEDSTAEELIDFLEFAEDNPNAKFKFMRNGKEVIIDAKKAAAILGQGSAIHEEARQLKIERAEFDEYVQELQARQEGLTLAMEFTVQPKLQSAYDEIVKVQNYQNTFQQQLAATRDPAQRARIQASMQQNERYIAQQQAVIREMQPAVEQFRQLRSQQVSTALEASRKRFTDKELKNEFVFNEVREKVAKVWGDGANQEFIPGVKNIDLLSSDENLLSLVRDGLKYRSKPTTKTAGGSMAQLTTRKGSTPRGDADSNISKLREQAKSGDKKAADNLLMQRLQSIRAGRGSR